MFSIKGMNKEGGAAWITRVVTSLQDVDQIQNQLQVHPSLTSSSSSSSSSLLYYDVKYILTSQREKQIAGMYISKSPDLLNGDKRSRRNSVMPSSNTHTPESHNAKKGEPEPVPGPGNVPNPNEGITL